MMEERMNFIYDVYEQAEIDNVFKSICGDAITVIAHELQYIKMKNEAQDTDENAEKIMIAVVDELSDRMKTEVRYRIQLMKRELEKIEKENKKVA